MCCAAGGGVVRAFSGPVDLGASIITGLVGNPVHILLKQRLRLRGLPFTPSRFVPPLHFIERHGLVFDQKGRPVDRAMDQRVERDVFNRALAATNHFRHNAQAAAQRGQAEAKADAALPALDDARGEAMAGASQQSDDPYASDRGRLQLEGGVEEAERMSLLTGMTTALRVLDIRMSAEERALYHWLVAELEYGCAAPLDTVSMTHWSQHYSTAQRKPQSAPPPLHAMPPRTPRLMALTGATL